MDRPAEETVRRRGRGWGEGAVVYHTSLLISASPERPGTPRPFWCERLAHMCHGGGGGGGGQTSRRGRAGQTSVNYGGRKTFTALPRRKASLFFFFLPFLLRAPGDTNTHDARERIYTPVAYTHSLLCPVPRGILKVYVSLLLFPRKDFSLIVCIYIYIYNI